MIGGHNNGTTQPGFCFFNLILAPPRHVFIRSAVRVDSFRVLLGFTGFYGLLLGSTGFYWVFLGSFGYLRVSIMFDRVEPDSAKVRLYFIGFYWVLPGFTGFY